MSDAASSAPTASSTTSAWRLVAEQEVSGRLRDRTFVGGVIFTLLLVVGAIVLSAVLSGRGDDFRVAVTDPAGHQVVETGGQVITAQDADSSVEAVPVADPSAAEVALREDEVDAALLPADGGWTLLGDDEVDTELSAALTSAAANTALTRNAQEAGTSLQELTAGGAVEERLLSGEDEGAQRAIGFFAAIFFYLTALTFGLTIAQSVVREKESRVVEILAAATPIRSLLTGKVVGNTVLALGQVVLLLAVGLAGLALTGRGDVLGGVGVASLWYVVFFVLGFVGLAAMFAVAGALATKQEDLQATTLPGQVLLLGPYLLAVTGGDTVQEVMSMVPIVSTMTMPGRILTGEAPAWQVVVAVAATALATMLLVRLGARLYERTLLQTSRRVGYREALRAGPR
jgi:ABC-2 type transport system permease protein